MGLLLLVRHGQASFGADDYDVLSDTGRAQCQRLGAWLAEHRVTPSSLVTGGMRRHRDSAAALVAGGGWTDVPVTVDGGWDEFDHLAVVAAHREVADLDADGQLDRRGFQRLFERATAAWIATEGGEPYPEPYAGFTGRVLAALDRAVAGAGSGRTVVVVTSGGPIATAAARLVDPDGDAAARARAWQRLNAVLVNSSLSRVVVGSTGPRLLTYNEHAHLGGDLLTYR